MIAMATVMIVILIEGMMAIVVVMMALNKCYLPPYIFFHHFINPHTYAVYRSGKQVQEFKQL